MGFKSSLRRDSHLDTQHCGFPSSIGQPCWSRYADRAQARKCGDARMSAGICDSCSLNTTAGIFSKEDVHARLKLGRGDRLDRYG